MDRSSRNWIPTNYGKASGAGLCGESGFSGFRDLRLYKTMDPLEVPGRMLTVGEYNRLVNAIKELNELVTEESELDELEDEAKN